MKRLLIGLAVAGVVGCGGGQSQEELAKCLARIDTLQAKLDAVQAKTESLEPELKSLREELATASKPKSTSVQEVVQANSFSLVDKNGKSRGTFSVSDTGPSLQMWDENSGPRVSLAILNNSPLLCLHDANGKFRAKLSLSKDESDLRLSMFHANGKLGASMIVNEKLGEALVLTGADGKPRAGLEHGGDTDKCSLTLFDQTGKEIFSTTNRE